MAQSITESLCIVRSWRRRPIRARCRSCEASIRLARPRAVSDEGVVVELAEWFARVVSRSAGRARFLFVCASERLHSLGVLERRTGSLFPPSNRYELPRIAVPAASAILDRVLSLSGIAAD